MIWVWLPTLAMMATPTSGPSGSDRVQAMMIEGTTLDGAFAGVDSAGTVRFRQGGDVRVLVPDQLTLLRWTGARPADPPTTFPATVYLADGSRLRARIVTGDGQRVELATPLVDKCDLPMSSLAAIRFASAESKDAQAAFDKAFARRDPSRDLLIVTRTDRPALLRGVTESLGSDGGTFRWRDRSVPIDPARTFGLVFAAGVQQAASPPALCRTRDGSVWAGTIVGGGATTLELKWAGGRKIVLPVAELLEIRFRSDRVRFLSDLEPASYTFEPFGVTRWPYRKDRSVANRPLRIGEQTFARGIGMHAQATLVYALDGPYAKFAAVIGIDEAVGPRGNVIFRVTADGKEVFKSGPVTGRDAPQSILVKIDSVQELALIVEFGDDLDLGDQADWGNARLIK